MERRRQTSSILVRPIDSARMAEVYVPPLAGYLRPSSRLDFNIGYDISEAVRVEIGGTNILRQKSHMSRRGVPILRGILRRIRLFARCPDQTVRIGEVALSRAAAGDLTK
jgi:hypothetical protein